MKHANKEVMMQRHRAFSGNCDAFSFYITVMERLHHRLILPLQLLCFSFVSLNVTRMLSTE